MELRTIELLLEKYFDAETTVAQEEQLKNYFTGKDVAPHLQQYRQLFGYFEAQQQERFSGQLPLKRTLNRFKWASVAASVVLLSGMGWFIATQQTAQPKEDLGTFNDPEVAFRETQKALNMVSKNVNVGVNSINYLGEYEKSRKTIFKE